MEVVLIALHLVPNVLISPLNVPLAKTPTLRNLVPIPVPNVHHLV